MYAVLAGASVLLAVGLMLPGGDSPSPSSPGGDKAVVYMSSGCGCCGYYTEYLKRETNLHVKRVVKSNLQAVKEKKGIPSDLQSCHTSIVDGYVVEGHVPVAAIEKLRQEEPSVTGIALPGMPSGSPGMPGTKQGKWTVYTFHEDGSSSEFMEL